MRNPIFGAISVLAGDCSLISILLRASWLGERGDLAFRVRTLVGAWLLVLVGLYYLVKGGGSR